MSDSSLSGTPPLYALIVGINEWIAPKVPNLTGCCNDVLLMQRVLRERFGVSDDNITVLVNDQATRKGIEDAFRKALIDRARAWKESGAEGPEPAFVFHFSGHGSRAKDRTGTQSDGWDETLVPSDSRVGDVYDIKDWEIAHWLEELTSLSNNVTVILDCCHGGSGTRNTESLGVERECPYDERHQVSDRSKSSGPSTATPIVATTRGSTETDSGATLPYLLLAACRNDEVAREYPVPVDDQSTTDDESASSSESASTKYGAFSWFLANELMSLSDTDITSYRDVFERVRYEVHSHFPAQMPQVRGDQDRVLFGGARVRRDPLLSISKIKNGNYWVDAGAIHGLTKQSEMLVYPPDTRTLADAGEPIATLQIKALLSTQCRCRLKEHAEVLLHSRVLLPPPFVGPSKKGLCLKIEDVELAQDLASQLSDSEAAPYIEVRGGEDGGDFQITHQSNCFVLRGSDGRVLVEPESDRNIDALVNNLVAICKYKNALALKNLSPGSFLRGKIEVKFHQVAEDELDDDDFDDQNHRGVRKVEPIPTTSEGIPIIEMEKLIAIEVINRSKRKLFCKAISFGHSFGIAPLDFASDEKSVAPGESKWFGLDLELGSIRFATPEDPDEAERFTEALESLKVIASEDEDLVPSLAQASLKQPTGEFDVDQAVKADGTRTLQVSGPKRDKNDWTTVETEYLVIAPQESNTQEMTGGETISLPQYSVSVEAPDGFDARVGVMTETQNTRMTPENVSVRPQGMVWESELIAPIDFAPKRSIAPPGNAIIVSAETGAFDRISVDHPLNLSVESRPNQSTLAVLWDGACCYPVGLSQTGDVPVTWMPLSSSTASIDDAESIDGDGQTRGLWRTAKLYLYSLLEFEAPDLGLHQSRFVPQGELESTMLSPGERVVPQSSGEVRIMKIDSAMDIAGKQVLLVVHGFSSDGPTAIRQLSSILGEDINRYDAVLTYDYESFATPISKSGEELSKSLSNAGFGPDDRAKLDVVAVGMGALVARSMIEQHGGGEFVDRCCFAGPPNRGTKLMSAEKAVSWISTAVFNAAGPNPASVFLSAAMKKIVADAVALSDLKPGSELLRTLNASGKVTKIPYHILAGRYQVAGKTEPAWLRAASAVGDFGMEQFFGDQHDLIVDTASMTGIESDGVTIDQVTSHHFDYWENPIVGEKMVRWMG